MDELPPSRSVARNDRPVTPCPLCGQPFTPVGRQQVCSAACRQARWRRSHPSPPPAIPARTSRPTTVYECPACETRYLGTQRCPDCGVFCRRVGPGGCCPHCDEPVALADLLPYGGTEGGEATPPRAQLP
jgi:hypothetical protein